MLRIILAALAAAAAPRARAEDCTTGWEAFSSRPYEQIAFPDTYVTYWRYRFALSPTAPLALRLTGKFAHARYISFNVYDAQSGDAVSGIADRAIAPDDGSINPYEPGVPREAGPRDYTVWAAAAGAKAPLAGQANVMSLPPPVGADGKPRFAEVWYRVYVSDDATDPNGKAPLPRIEAFDAAGAPTACPPRGDVPQPEVYDAFRNLPPRADDHSVNFFRPHGGGVYANGDNKYLVARFSFFGTPVAVVKVKAPVFPDTGAGLGTLSAGDDMRYWSFCLGGLDQRTSSCLADAAMKVGADGFVRLVVGPPSLAGLAKERGFDFLPWGRQLAEVLIYRNLMARDDFAGNLAQVKTYVLGGSVADYKASRFIGDYAPQGKECDRAEFTADSCGL